MTQKKIMLEKRPGFVGLILDVFSSIWTGVGLLTFLFIYSSIGSALPAVRQGRFFEMTEFEWFHWWPFDVCMGLIFAVMLCVTLRKVPFNKLTAGTWMTHVGILILGLGSWIYFGSKVEGDTPVVRRLVEISVPGHQPVELIALPGSQTSVGSNAERYTFSIASINPDWPILSGEDKGKKAYSVKVQVSGGGQKFVRQLLAGYEQYTEDIIPGQGRAIKSIGKKLVDESLKMRLGYVPQKEFFLSDSRAIYLREAGSESWSVRPIEQLPRYNDYVTSRDQVWGAAGLKTSSLNLQVAAANSHGTMTDPVAVTGYLRYAQPREGYVKGGSVTNPVAEIRLESEAGKTLAEHRLLALDPSRQATEDGLIQFHWMADETAMAGLTEQRAKRLSIQVPGKKVSLDVEITETLRTNDKLEFAEIPGTDYSYRIRFISDHLQIPGKGVVSLVVVEIRHGGREFIRWVGDNPSLTRDLPMTEADGHEAFELDEAITMQYDPGIEQPLVTLVASPNAASGLQFLIRRADGEITPHGVHQGDAVSVGRGVVVRLVRYIKKARRDVRPAIVPRAQRQKNARESYSMIQVSIGTGQNAVTKWVPYQPYVLPNEQYNYDRFFQVRPVLFKLTDGRKIEVIFSREKRPLPQPVVLDDFVLTSHVGGFTGTTASIRDWTSLVRFKNGDGLTDSEAISTNAPIENNGYWFFQSYWDAPLSGRSAGFNFTGLGVGNRHGVIIQLTGCIVAVLGMIYAFYVKAVFRRRRKPTGRVGVKITDKTSSPTLPDESLDLGQAGRFKAVIGLCVGLLVLGSIYMYGSRNRGNKASVTKTAFAEQVDLSPLTQVAVHADGRLKSFDSFAREMMRFASGPHKINGQSAMLSYLDLMLRPEAYYHADILYVKNKPVRRQIADVATSKQVGQSEDWAKRFMKRGLISPQILHQRPIAELLERLAEDLVRTAKFVDEIRSAQTVVRSDFLESKLTIIPPVDGDSKTRWFALADALGSSVPRARDAAHAGMGGSMVNLAGLSEKQNQSLTTIWDSLDKGWVAQDVAAVNQAVRELATFLPGIEPALYPSKDRLKWEGWYFQKHNLTWIWLIYMFSVLFLLMSIVYKWKAARWLGLGIFLLAFSLHTVALLLRWYVSGRWPNSNMFEAITTAAWFGGCAALIFELLGRKSEMRNLFALGSACASMAALMSVHFLPLQLNPAIGNMMPILHDIWLYIHTNVIIFSYCLIGMAAVTGTLYLLWRVSGGGLAHARAGGAGMLMASGLDKGPTKGSVGRMFDGATMVLMELSFVLLWTGIVMGAIWADHSWGRPWGWDPKEVFALNTFIIFILLIHVRMKVVDKGFWTAILAVAGCGVMLFNWIVINFVISGLHSYA